MNHTIKFKVRFSDTDLLGHVNNSRYFTYMEEARCAFFEEVLGFESDLPMIIAAANVNFRAQTYYPQTLRLESRISRWGNSSFDVTTEIYDDETGKLHFDGVAVIVLFDYEQQKSMKIPQEFREKMAPYAVEAD